MITEKQNSPEYTQSRVALFENLKFSAKNDLKQLIENLDQLTLNKRNPTNYQFTHSDNNLFEFLNKKTRVSSKNRTSSIRTMNENSLNQKRIQSDELKSDKTKIKSKSSSFIRNLSLKLKSSNKSRRHTTSLCEVNKNASIKRTNIDSSTYLYSSNFNKPLSSNESVFLKDPHINNSNKRIFENETKKLKDCQHQSDSKCHARKHIDESISDQMVPRVNLNESSFENFNSLNFYKQCNLVTNWFKDMNEENKNSLLSRFLEHCGPNQNHLFSLKIVQLHGDCAPNCCDMITFLPKMVSLKIFSYLDPVSLARCCQVSHLWNELANDSLLWKNFCFLSRWRFSLASEAKQLAKYTFDNQIYWKLIFAERFRVKRNWLTGKSMIKTFYGHEGAVSCVQFDERRIVAGSSIGNIKVWNLESNSSTSASQSSLMPYLNLFGHSGTIRCLHLDGSQSKLFSGSADHTIKVWDLSEVHPTWSRVTCKMTFLGHTDTVRCLQVRGSQLISGSYDNTLKIWNIETGACIKTLLGHIDSVLCLQFDHEKIISGSADKTIKIWNLENGTCIKTLTGHTGSITCLYFDSQRIISGSLDFDIKLWRIDNGTCINTLNWITNEGHTAAIRCLKADSQKIISCSDDKTIKIWNIETGERYVTLRNHSDGVTCLSFNDYYILSGSFDRTIKLWDFS